MKKKYVSTFVAALLCSAMLAGCGQTGGTTEETKAAEKKKTEAETEGPKEETTAASLDVVEINYLTWRNQPDRHPEKLIAAFQEENPNIKVNYKVIKNLDEYLQAQQVRLLSGTDIDVTSIRPESIENYVDAGYLLDLTGDAYLANYKEGTLDNITVDGKVYGVPGAVNMIAMYYNKDMFESNGIKVPTTYDEFLAACDAFKEKGIYAMANGCKDGWPVGFDPYIFFNDLMIQDQDFFGKIDKEEAKYTDSIFTETMKKVEEFYQAGYLSPDSMSFTGDDATALFVGQKVPMLCQGEWQAPVFDDAELEYDLGVFALPAVTGNEIAVPVTVGHYESVIASSKHPEEARKFVEFMSNQEGASITSQEMTSFSPVTGVELQGDSKITLFNPLLEEKSVDFFYSRQKASENSEMYKLMQEMFLGAISSDELCTKLQEYHDNNK